MFAFNAYTRIDQIHENELCWKISKRANIL